MLSGVWLCMVVFVEVSGERRERKDGRESGKLREIRSVIGYRIEVEKKMKIKVDFVYNRYIIKVDKEKESVIMERLELNGKTYDELVDMAVDRYGSYTALMLTCVSAVEDDLFDSMIDDFLNKHDETMTKLFESGASFEVINERIESFQSLFDLLMAIRKASKKD